MRQDFPIPMPRNTRSDLKNRFPRSDLVLRGMQGRTSAPVTVLFSPGAASFEKFLHEFDRGEQFNALARKVALTK